MPQRRKAVSWRSGLEQRNMEDLTSRGVPFRYEEVKLKYTKPASAHKYTPDFILPNGIVVETKGIFDSDDRAKHLLVRSDHPDIDIRFVFTRSAALLRKGAKSTYGQWCQKNGFQFADKLIPSEWLDEPTNELSLAAIERAAA